MPEKSQAWGGRCWGSTTGSLLTSGVFQVLFTVGGTSSQVRIRQHSCKGEERSSACLEAPGACPKCSNTVPTAHTQGPAAIGTGRKMDYKWLYSCITCSHTARSDTHSTHTATNTQNILTLTYILNTFHTLSHTFSTHKHMHTHAHNSHSQAHSISLFPCCINRTHSNAFYKDCGLPVSGQTSLS